MKSQSLHVFYGKNKKKNKQKKKNNNIKLSSAELTQSMLKVNVM